MNDTYQVRFESLKNSQD